MSSYYVFDDDDCVGGEYGYYGNYVYPEELGPVTDEQAEEQWMPIEDGTKYWISTIGRIWSISSKKFMKPKKMDRQGHLGIAMSCAPNKLKYKYTHRLMAEAFLQNPKNDPIVRHLDDDKTNNSIENLAWGTQKDNHQDSVRNGTARNPTSEEAREYSRPRMIPIVVKNRNTGEIRNFECINDASRYYGIPQSNILKVLKGERRHAGGYFFRKGVEPQ